jgi:hypothetical protein
MMLLAFVLCSGFGYPQSAVASLIIDIQQVGSDVDLTMSGSINTAALTGPGGTSSQTAPYIYPSYSTLGTGTAGAQVSLYTGSFSGPSSWGTGSWTYPTTTSGDAVFWGGVSAPGKMWLPLGYATGSSLSASMTWSGQTLATLGLTIGTYTETWGTGPTADSLTVNVSPAASVPEPSTAILAAIWAVSGIGCGLVRRRRAQRGPSDAGHTRPNE